MRYEHWECYLNGMYKKDASNLKGVVDSANLLCNESLFETTIKKLETDWPTSFKVHMTNNEINRRAYLGAAACCFHCGVNEDTVRLAWRLIDKDSQDSANRVAQAAIMEFESRQKASNQSQYQLF